MERVITVLLLLALLAPPAYASQGVGSSGRAIGAPALAGERVVALEAGGLRRPPRLLSLSGPPAPPIVLATGSGRASSFAYAASETVVAALRHSLPAASQWRYDLLLGAPAGRLARVGGCPGVTAAGPPPAPAVHGTDVAWAGARCSVERIEIRTADGRVEAVDTGRRVVRVALAGRWLAWIAEQPDGRASATVYDRTTRSVAFTADAGVAGFVGDVDVDVDGTVAVASYPDVPGGEPEGSCGSLPRPRITWYGVFDPAPHPIADAACHATVRVASGRVAYLRDAPAGRGVELVLSRLDGSDPRPLAAFETLFATKGTFDWDGFRAAWSQTRCRDHSIRTRTVDDASGPDAAAVCPVGLSHLRLRRDGNAYVRVTCPNGCRSAYGMGLAFASPSWLRFSGRTRGVVRRSTPARFDIAPGRSKTVRLRLTDRQAARVRREGGVAVRLRATGQLVYRKTFHRTLR